MVVAFGDGVGALTGGDNGTSVGATLSVFARERGDVTLLLGWTPAPLNGIDPRAFRRVVALMPGWGVRAVANDSNAIMLPTSLAAVPSVLSGPLRPDLLITRMVRRGGTLQFGTEVSWQQMLLEDGVPVWAVVDEVSPAASAEAPVAQQRVTVIATTARGPWELAPREPEPIHEALADQVLRFVPAGVRLQYGPGQLGTALLRRTKVALQIDTGLLTDAVVDLDRRGLLAGTPSATYLLGSGLLNGWADGKPILRGLDYSHDKTRLSRGMPFVAVNTAIEIDCYGQINVEGVNDRVVGGIGGHPDYCNAARLSRGGLSIIAVPSRFGERSTFVERLSRPASTPAYDVEVIVTEQGAVDLRSADWDQRRRLITRHFEAAA
ncbi:acetyl-CoA hydrolase/transferase C-terminal domain-containing protein [Mycobacterium sp. E1747]|uniref:acetyl-CoA hydrolase/transferase C-terminal domain-containing protein n=1 Tax=Mycobacterium sp. E1747 TaxID=1834128 RepID=UPI0009EF6748|nr:acetyl-CoA hydrolase/transferase C-terminal domain-containing protein [Mycobacterium sp. E1747]